MRQKFTIKAQNINGVEVSLKVDARDAREARNIVERKNKWLTIQSISAPENSEPITFSPAFPAEPDWY